MWYTNYRALAVTIMCVLYIHFLGKLFSGGFPVPSRPFNIYHKNFLTGTDIITEWMRLDLNRWWHGYRSIDSLNIGTIVAVFMVSGDSEIDKPEMSFSWVMAWLAHQLRFVSFPTQSRIKSGNSGPGVDRRLWRHL